MRRFTLPPERVVAGRVTFDAAESRHLTRVLRLGPGDTVVATDGAGRDYTVRLDSVGEAASGTVLAVERGAPESPLAITLVQGIPKGDKMEAPAGTAEAFNKYLELAPTGPYADPAKQMLDSMGAKIETSFGKGRTPAKKK